MKLLYLSLSYLPSRRASSVQVMRMCDAFAGLGHEVTLLAKAHREPTAEGMDLHAFYGVPSRFAVHLLARPARRGGGVVYAAAVARRVYSRRRDVDLAYCRDLVGAVIATELGLPTVFEAHGTLEAPWQRTMWRRMLMRPSFVGLVAISEALVRVLDADRLLPRNRPVVVAHSAAEPFAFKRPREHVSEPPRIGYVGNLYAGRGIELLLELARREPSYRVEIVGGTESDLRRLRMSGVPDNVVLHGFVPPARLPDLYRGFDVLMMPYPRSHVRGPTRGLDTSRYCSPMKMFEYMGSGVPIVASDLPVLQEVLRHDHNALIAPIGDVAAWQAAVSKLILDPALRGRLAANALEDAQHYTPSRRAARILAGLQL